MSSKIFASYKYADDSVYELEGEPETTVRTYVDKFEELLGENIFKGEKDGEDLSELSDETIWEKLKNRIYDKDLNLYDIVYDDVIRSYYLTMGVTYKYALPFLLGDKMIYLPFMATYLSKMKKTRQYEKLQPSAQVVLLKLLYDKDREVMLSELRSGLLYSAMTVSRAAEQLVQAGLVAAHKDGVKVIIERNDDPKTLFDNARPFLIDPVIKTCYAEREAVSDQCIKAGLTALSEKTMLADDAFETFAIKSGVLDEDILHDEKMDPARQVRMEIWKYDPQLLQRGRIIDPLSLALTLDDSADERVEQAKEGLMNNRWEELTW